MTTIIKHETTVNITDTGAEMDAYQVIERSIYPIIHALESNSITAIENIETGEIIDVEDIRRALDVLSGLCNKAHSRWASVEFKS